MTKSFDIIDHFRSLTAQLLARDSLSGTLFSHGTIRGDETENIVRDLLRTLLPSNYRVETGQLVVPGGIRSPQSDVIVFKDDIGAVLGVSEDGNCLVHAEAARVIIEVKRHLGKTQVSQMSDYCRRLHASFHTRQSSWCQWGIAFRSPHREDTLLRYMNATHTPESSIGLLLVLDTRCRRQNQREPEPALFGCPTGSSAYNAQGDRAIPPLLEFIENLFASLDPAHPGMSLALRRFRNP